ncbi:recombinase family protein [Tsukamurella sputi]|uniref:Recombinase family protein n=1 Tax=Tsukamurella sputi TaxID=2591848 RepID=A0A5C5RL80_9ACTN|nr:recombinase family protein [Tsukamurella sputi]
MGTRGSPQRTPEDLVRLSRVTDATTSPERQLAACQELCQARGYDVVGVAEDVDVSAGKSSPFDRPQLGRWLRDPAQYDVIVFFHVDGSSSEARSSA